MVYLNQKTSLSKCYEWLLMIITTHGYEHTLITLLSKMTNHSCYQHLLINMTAVSKPGNYKIQPVYKLCLNSDK